MNNNGTKATTTSRLMPLNARSIKNKDNIIMAELENQKVEIAVLTDTWIKLNQLGESWLNQSNSNRATMTSSHTTNQGTREREE